MWCSNILLEPADPSSTEKKKRKKHDGSRSESESPERKHKKKKKKSTRNTKVRILKQAFDPMARFVFTSCEISLKFPTAMITIKLDLKLNFQVNVSQQSSR
ncbi:hypothetical protein BSL78_18704 [Apostichopus japonicus]|uniref:Uncharacterized protein n=1 Tax=Stichopus japonicus TaxID=307972 RepID=A0A2G8K8W1_STIJA|nr:hypothetical protein BSL78_18704 [Apostichopus japonicus]